MQYVYRFGTLEDVEPLVAVFVDEFNSNPRERWQGYLTADPDGLRAWYLNFVKNGNAFLLVLTEDGAIVGGLAVKIAKYHYAKESVMIDEGFIVHKNHRRTKIATNLIKWAKHLADHHEVPLVLGHDSGENVDQTGLLFEKNNMIRIGAFFLHKKESSSKH